MNKLVVITGGTGGLGKTVTKQFLAADYQVVVTYHSDNELKDLLEFVADKKSHLEALRIDVTDEASLDELAQRIEKKYKKVDTLVCLVGGFAAGTLVENAAEIFDKQFAINAKSFLLTVNAIVPLMKKGGSARQIIGVASRLALEPIKGIGIYAASKAALVSLVKTLAKELLADNITVNAVAPSTIDTAANRKAMPKADPKTWVKPATIAETVLFLASDQASATSGAIVPIYGQV